MKISEVFPSKYITAADLQGRTITLTIKAVTLEEMITHDSKKVTKPVAWFERTEKGFVMNMTNAKIIAGLYGDDTAGWKGERVSLYPTRVKAFGSMQDCIRVREEVPAKPKPATTAAERLEETSGVDDDEDVADYEEEGDPPRNVDPDTGEIIGAIDGDVLFEPDPTPAPSKPATLRPVQLTRIAVLMADAYGVDADGPKLAEFISKGSAHRLEDLLPAEADVLIRSLEKKIRDDKAAKLQPVAYGKPVTA